MNELAKLGLWTLGLAAFGYFYAGQLVYGALIGPDWRAYPLGGLRWVLSNPDVSAAVIYGDEKEAMRLYEQLETKADVCAGCSAPCLGSCPVGIDIPTRTRGAHEMLTLA
jgi:hypothetical protein